MKFASIRDLRTNTAALRETLKKEREIVVTVNGRPFALMVPTDPDRLEEDLLELRRARAKGAIARIRAKAKAEGLDTMTMEEIDAIIAEARQEYRKGK